MAHAASIAEQPLGAEQNRVQALGAPYFGALALKSTFDPESGLSLEKRRMVYGGLPKELTEEEVSTLAEYVGQNVASEEVAPERKLSETKLMTAEVRALKWLGSISHARGDQVTAENASRTLSKQLGVRGKLAALALRYEFRKI
jgi:hypothetical protein